ncbi:AT-hook motif nuclear-localized protein 23-like [Rosa rugosa]|uniref:AT-hook motif nuclear-localized protein 23-like n=1 Tax=Rosa rugosa TaxID=74645 RepID=UPI002B400F98|nr:AT-hook motif nuclear-localized protein 23-like [Rosa rugosa]
MADYGGQGLNFSALNSDDDDSDHSPKSMAGACGGKSSSSSSSRVVKLEPVFRSPHQLSGVELRGRGSPSRAGEMMMVASSSRKPRGRPPGSKNRPRPPIVINKESESGMQSVVIEISAGSDVVESLVQYARRRRVGITVLSGCGSVSSVTLRRPLLQSHHAPAPAMSLHGPFNLLSLSGSFMESLATCSFGISLAGSQGQVFGGIVGGQVIAASLVVVVAATFRNPRFHKLPAGPGLASGDESDDDDTQDTKPSLLLGGCATGSVVVNHAHETTSCGFGGGSGSGSSSATTAAAISTCVYGGGVSPQPMNCLQVSHSHHDQLVQPWGGPPSRPPLPPHY